MVTFATPNWVKTKVILTKGSRVKSFSELEKPLATNLTDLNDFLKIEIINLKQYDMFDRFPIFMRRDIFVKVVTKCWKNI